MNEFDTTNASTMIYRPEVVSVRGIHDAIARCRAINSVLSLEVWVPAERSAEYRGMMENQGFSIAGTATDASGRLYVKHRRQLRTSGDGRLHVGEVSTGMYATPIPPSDEEKQALALMAERYSDVAIEARVKALGGA